MSNERNAKHLEYLMQGVVTESHHKALEAGAAALREIDTLRAQLAAANRQQQRGEQCVGKLRELAHGLGWDGVNNSKILEVFLEDALAAATGRAEKAEAELKAANERAEKAEVERADALRCSGENAKAWQEAVCDEAVKRTHLLKEIGLTEQQRDALAARVAELEAQLAEARKEAANLIRQTTPMPISLDPYERGKFDGRMYAVEQLEG